jgi:four helix bundle protein
MDEKAFKVRTKKLGLHVIELVEGLPRTRTAEVIGRQLLRSGTSVGANYRSACRGKSIPDVLSKLAIVEEEADETVYWLELLIEAKIVSGTNIAHLVKETDEIIAMTVASIKTLRGTKTKATRFTDNGRPSTSEMSGNPKSKIENPKLRSDCGR